MTLSVDDALAMWADFPVTATPRPLVLTEHDIIGPRSGFRNEDMKNAYIDGNFVPPPSFPSTPPTVDDFPIIAARDALEALRTAGDGQWFSKEPLKVTTIELQSATFPLDRVPRVLPAWLFSFRDVEHPAAVLAVAYASRFMPPNIPYSRRITGARVVGRDATTLTVTFIGGPPETNDYAGDAVESGTAVAVLIEATRVPTGPHHLVGYRREVQVKLRAPLGERVLIDGTSGAPAAVIT
jgi:hypothetical protein